MANPDDDFRRFKRILASRNADYDFEKPQRLYLLDIDPDGQHRRRLLGDSLREAVEVLAAMTEHESYAINSRLH